MGSAWLGKPCQDCGGKKGKKYVTTKFCGRCTFQHNKANKAAAHGRAIEKRYGITAQEYWDLYEYQDGRCYICRRATGKTRRLTVDHDHKTGLVRGLLCRPCNNILGHFRDDPDCGFRIAYYLNHPPFTAMLDERRSIDGASDGGTRGDPA